MRFVFATAFAALFNHAQADSCQAYCNDLADCRDDPDEQGSYCKTWQDPDVCFGLYWTDDSETTMCYQPNSSAPCPEDRPVRCPAVVDNCQDVCNNTPGCINDPHAHGSYCKDWQDPQVCFGLYYTDASRTATCFQPSEFDACPEEFPVECVEA
jgi:hypothetical protein